jgi:HSP20 family protein
MDLERRLAEFDALRREMNRYFDAEPRRRGGFAATATWPRIGLYDRGNDLLVRAELPGVADEDLEINLDQGVLTLKGERKLEVPEGYSVHRQERRNVSFSRSFSLPCKVDPEKTEAHLKSGVLNLVLPKAAEDQPRKITVSAK